MNLSPDYWLIWSERNPRAKYSQKFPTLEGLNDFLAVLRADNIAEVEIISGFCLEKRINQ